MAELNRRHLLLGGTAALAGVTAVPVLGSGPALADAGWRQFTFTGIPGGGKLVTFVGPFGVSGATYVNDKGTILDQARLDVTSSSVKYWTKFSTRGRVLPQSPSDPNGGIFATPPTSGEYYRIDVAGFGIIVLEGASQRVRLQVVGSNGQRHTAEFPRFQNAAGLQALIDTFVDQTNALNLQYRNYQNVIRQYTIGFAPAAITAMTALIVSGANPLTITVLIAGAVTGGIALIGNIVNASNTYLTTFNQLIETFERIANSIDLDGVDIARYNVGGVRWNNANLQLVAQPQYSVINVPNP